MHSAACFFCALGVPAMWLQCGHLGCGITTPFSAHQARPSRLARGSICRLLLKKVLCIATSLVQFLAGCHPCRHDPSSCSLRSASTFSWPGYGFHHSFQNRCSGGPRTSRTSMTSHSPSMSARLTHSSAIYSLLHGAPAADRTVICVTYNSATDRV